MAHGSNGSNGTTITQPTLGLVWPSRRYSKPWAQQFMQIMAIEYGVKVVSIDVENDLEAQGPFSVILHSLADHLAYAAAGKEGAVKIIQRIQSYVKANLHSLLIDPISHSMRRLTCRYKTYKFCRRRLSGCGNIKIPPSAVVHKSDSINVMRQKFINNGVTFPAVVKSCQSNDHQMAIVMNEKSLDQSPLTYPLFVQSFVEHGGVLYKLYCVGDQWAIVVRPSIAIENWTNDTIYFCTANVSKEHSVSAEQIRQLAKMKCPIPDVDIEHLLSLCRRHLRVTQFGVDLVVGLRSSTAYIIDINYAPGFDGYPNVARVMADYVMGRMREGRLEMDDLHSSESELSTAHELTKVG